LDDIIKYYKDEKGKIFGPKIVDIFLENIEEIRKIRDTFSD